MKGNDQILQKTIQLSDIALGGRLDPEHQEEFARLVREYTRLLSIVRFEKLTQMRGSIDRLHIGEPITTSAAENTLPVTLARPKMDRIDIVTTKLRSDWNITRETMLENIERAGFEDTVMQTMAARMRTDFEMLAIQGDPTTFAAVNTPVGYLLRNNTGWDLLTNGAHIVNASGAEIAREMFSATLRALPADKQVDNELRWLINPQTLIDYVDLYGGRATTGGDQANVEGTISQLMGLPVTVVPLIPANQTLTIAAATSGATLGNQLDPFIITAGTNAAVTIDVDNAGAVAITLTAGLRQVNQIASDINTALVAAGRPAVAYDDGYGRLLLQSPTTGAASEIDVQAVANSAYATLGLTVGVYVGSAAGAGGTMPEGTFVWLTNPKNFIWAMTLQTAVFSEFDKDFDRMEFTTFSFHDFVVENLDAVVKLTNVRRRALL